MSSNKRSAEVEGEDIEDEDEDKEEVEPPKAAKKLKASTVSETKHDAKIFDLGGHRKVSINQFKGSTLIDIREFYKDKSGEMKPGKKGISLTVEQFDSLLGKTTEIQEAVALLK